MVEVWDIENIAKHKHELIDFLGHAHMHEENTAYYIVKSFDINDNLVGRTVIINFIKD